MAEAELPSVEHLAGKITGALPAVKLVAENGVAEVVKVNPDLVGAAGVESAFDQAHFAARSDNAIFGLR